MIGSSVAWSELWQSRALVKLVSRLLWCLMLINSAADWATLHPSPDEDPTLETQRLFLLINFGFITQSLFSFIVMIFSIEQFFYIPGTVDSGFLLYEIPTISLKP